MAVDLVVGLADWVMNWGMPSGFLIHRAAAASTGALVDPPFPIRLCGSGIFFIPTRRCYRQTLLNYLALVSLKILPLMGRGLTAMLTRLMIQGSLRASII